MVLIYYCCLNRYFAFIWLHLQIQITKNNYNPLFSMELEFKCCYLMALVAGHFVLISTDSSFTSTNWNVVDKGKAPLESLIVQVTNVNEPFPLVDKTFLLSESLESKALKGSANQCCDAAWRRCLEKWHWMQMFNEIYRQHKTPT